jgi:hypothetical protein
MLPAYTTQDTVAEMAKDIARRRGGEDGSKEADELAAFIQKVREAGQGWERGRKGGRGGQTRQNRQRAQLNPAFVPSQPQLIALDDMSCNVTLSSA